MSRSIRVEKVSSLIAVAVVGGAMVVQGCASGGGGGQPAPTVAAAAGSTSCGNPVSVSTEVQRALVMAYAANGSAGICNSSSDASAVAQVAAARAKCLLDKESKGWKIVWGPVVQLEQNTPSPACPMPIPTADDDQWLAANTMFVAQNGAGEYLVAIAGTDPVSLYDWCDEDFTVSEHVAWTYGSAPTDAWITQGTHDGLQALAAMSDPAHGSLVDFLKSEVQSPGSIHLTVTGHSLGGALAPVAALWLKDGQKNWDPSGQSTVDVYAFAGATPGNASFAGYFNSRFPHKSLTVIDNPSDLVPRAWNSTLMGEVDASFYDRFPAYIKATDKSKIYELFQTLQAQATADFTRLGDASQQQCIPGHLMTKGELDWLVPLPSDHDAFDREALYQHIGAYPVALQLFELIADGNSCNCDNPPPGGWSPSGGCMPKPQYCS